MSGIGAVVPADKPPPAEARQPLERDSGKRPLPRRPRKQQSDDDMVETEPHQLDVEA
ncbi:MAG TPA: hypothetical protein VK822_15590 [Acetobacteraceae bacterium]|nr:hypothetical protein [Acetobacteraceae bacterium]